jgi:hypothetical protein
MQVVRFGVAQPPLFKKSLRSWQEEYKARRALLQELEAAQEEEPAAAAQPATTLRVRPKPSKARG